MLIKILKMVKKMKIGENGESGKEDNHSAKHWWRQIIASVAGESSMINICHRE